MIQSARKAGLLILGRTRIHDHNQNWSTLRTVLQSRWPLPKVLAKPIRSNLGTYMVLGMYSGGPSGLECAVSWPRSALQGNCAAVTCTVRSGPEAWERNSGVSR